MITRSACIKRAHKKMLQGATDPMFANEDWSDLFQSAVMRVWRELMDLKQAYFCQRKASIAHQANGVYPLPADFFEPIWVEETDGTPFYQVSLKREREELKAGWVVNGPNLVIVNYSDYPATLNLDYRHYPKEMADYTGADDAETSAFELDYPLNNQRGLRLLSNMIPMMAKVKDGSVTEPEFNLFFYEELRSFMPRFFTNISNN